MHGRIIFFASILLLTSCSKPSFLKADCNSCTNEEQEWNGFAWNELAGTWRGNIETSVNSRVKAKKEKTTKMAEVKFLAAKEFLKSKSLDQCNNLDANALVMNGILWEPKSNSQTQKEFDAFTPDENGKVVYGRVKLDKLNGQSLCVFTRYGRVMGKNRLELPSVEFTENSSNLGRSIASDDGKETTVMVEFLRFDSLAAKKPQKFSENSRMPASVKEQERPSLFFRIFKHDSQKQIGKTEWAKTEEILYRFWKSE